MELCCTVGCKLPPGLIGQWDGKAAAIEPDGRSRYRSGERAAEATTLSGKLDFRLSRCRLR